MLPQMMTDIEIRNNDNNSLIVIDAKYYKNAFSDRFGVEKHQSANMYQMNAYLDYYMGKYQSLRRYCYILQTDMNFTINMKKLMLIRLSLQQLT